MIIIGHRGARGLAPENTLVGLQKAIEHGVDEIEFDVRTTVDDVVVLHHDAVLHDVSGTRLAIDRHTYADLVQHKPDLPRLVDIFDAIGKVIPLYIEVKPGVSVEPVIAALEYALNHGFVAADLRVGSYSQAILREIHLTLPDITMIVIERWSGVRAGYRARQLGTKRISMNQRWLWWGFVGPVSRSGWQLTAYTVNNPRQAKSWQKMGLYGIVTDYPERFTS
ncbi:MAG: glycerophosphodiester phosphodiesterase [Candidatus Saccharimonadales bacterium]